VVPAPATNRVESSSLAAAAAAAAGRLPYAIQNYVAAAVEAGLVGRTPSDPDDALGEHAFEKQRILADLAAVCLVVVVVV